MWGRTAELETLKAHLNDSGIGQETTMLQNEICNPYYKDRHISINSHHPPVAYVTWWCSSASPFLYLDNPIKQYRFLQHFYSVKSFLHFVLRVLLLSSLLPLSTVG